MRSELQTCEAVANAQHRFGQGQVYYPVRVEDEDGLRPALFTPEQVEVAFERARTNPEDIPDDWYEDTLCLGFWERLKFLFTGVLP